MNETTSHDSEGLDDPALLAEIEAEFADLTREIERISAMPRGMAPEKNKLVEALRASWRDRLKGLGDRPEWRQRLDATIGHAVDRLLEDGIKENADGSLAFALRGDTLQAEGGPVIRGLLEGFAHMLEEKFPPPDKQPPPAPDAPPPNPMQALIGGLGSALAGVLKTAVQNPGAGGLGGMFKVDDGSSKVSVAGAAPKGAEAGTDLSFGAEQKLAATFEFDSRAKAVEPPIERGGEAKPGDGAAAGSVPPVGISSAAGTAANAFFQQLMTGFGQAIQQAAAGVLPAAKGPAAPPAASPTTGTDGADAKATTAESAPAPTPMATALSGIGQSLLQALQRAIGPGTAPLVVKAAPSPPPAASTAEPAADADGAVQPASDAEGEKPPEVERTTAPGPAPDEAPKPATLNIDFAGLLAQMLAGKKPPGG